MSDPQTTRRLTPEQLAAAAYNEVPAEFRLAFIYADLAEEARAVWLQIGRAKFNNGWRPVKV
jgi:hypothetical protein